MASASDLQTKYQNINDQLKSSTTAYAPNTLPTAKDISLDKQLAATNLQIEALRSKQLRSKWYGPTVTNDEATPPQDGLFLRGIKALQRPLNAITGTTQYVIGKGTDPTLSGTINKAMDSGLTFGNVLQQSGAPRGVAAPIGFVLDVFADPVNWLTAGTTALIPRVGAGFVKGFAKKAGTEVVESGLEGALKGAKVGLTSSLEKKAVTALNLVPFAKSSPKYVDFVENLGKKAIKGAEDYDKLVGSDVYSRLGSQYFGMGKKGYIGKKIEEGIKKLPYGEKAVDFLKYSPEEAGKIADVKDLAKKSMRDFQGEGTTLLKESLKDTGLKADFATVADYMAPDATVILKPKVNQATNKILSDANAALDSQQALPIEGISDLSPMKIRDESGALKEEFRGRITIADTKENAKAILDIVDGDYEMKFLTAAYKETPVGKTGVVAFDNFMDKLKATTVSDVMKWQLGDIKVGEVIKPEVDNLVEKWNMVNFAKSTSKDVIETVKNIPNIKPMEIKVFAGLLGGLETTTEIFKAAKVALNVGSHVVAVVGNIFMGAMMGLPVYKKEYLNSLIKASKLVKGKLSADGIMEMFFNDANLLIDMAQNNPSRFKQLTGLSAYEINKQAELAGDIKLALANTREKTLERLKQGLAEAKSGETQFKYYTQQEAIDAARVGKIGTAAEKQIMENEKIMKPLSTPSVNKAKDLESGSIYAADEYGTVSSAELNKNKFYDTFKEVWATEAKDHPGNPVYKLLDGMFNTMPKWYEQIDQSYKLGTVDYITRVGLTEQELGTIQRFVTITKDDILEPVISGGEKLYRLTPLAATSVATEAYMNYAAMPDFVKVMRSLPVFGANFFSFQYAIAAKTAKTLVNNPAVFNKIAFMLHEISGERSPQEKQALESKYNAYLKSDTVVKLFGTMNIDMKNYLPWVTMNMFNPSEKTYDNTAKGNFLRALDKAPIFQTAVGQVLKDYWIQPWVLSGTGQPIQGQFGQPVMPAFDENGNPIEPSLGSKLFYGGRTFAETMVPGSLSYLGLINSFANFSPGFIEAIPSYGFRTEAYATKGQTSIGASTKDNPFEKALRTTLSRSGIPTYSLNPLLTK